MKNFNDIYESVYKKCYEPLEEIRIAKKRKKFVLVILVIALVVNVILLFEYATFDAFICIISMFALIFVLRPGKKYNSIFKRQVIKTFVKEYNENLDYDQDRGVTPNKNILI